MKDIHEIVAGLVEEHGTNDPLELAEALGVMVELRDLGGLSGMYVQYKGQPIILLNRDFEKHDLIFACAHELGHHVQHSDLIKEPFLCSFKVFDFKDKTEYEANVFAAHLLIDDDELLDILTEGYDVLKAAMILEVNLILLNIKLSEMNREGYNFDTSWSTTRLY